MDIQSDHFTLFELPIRFAIDRDALDRAYRALQSEVHPDRFVSAGAAEQRRAMQWATKANEAYRVLRDPLQRAIYLCALEGDDPKDERRTDMPQDFLMAQLEWRETLDDARAAKDREAIESLQVELDARRATLVADVHDAIDRDDDVAKASALVRQWLFVERFGEDVRAALDPDATPVS